MKVRLSLTVIFVFILFQKNYGQKFLDGIDTLHYKISIDSTFKDTFSNNELRRLLVVDFYSHTTRETTITMISRTREINLIRDISFLQKSLNRKYRIDWYKSRKDFWYVGSISYIEKESIIKSYILYDDGSINNYRDFREESQKDIIYKKGEVYPDFDLSNLNKIPDFFKYYQVTNCKYGIGLESNWDCLPIEELRKQNK